MRQSRLMSLVEAMANVMVGYGVAVITQLLVFPLLGLQTTIRENLAIGANLHRRVACLELPAAADVQEVVGRLADAPPHTKSI